MEIIQRCNFFHVHSRIKTTVFAMDTETPNFEGTVQHYLHGFQHQSSVATRAMHSPALGKCFRSSPEPQR